MTPVASLRQIVERPRESIAILRGDRLPQILQRRVHHLRNELGKRQRRILVRRMKRDDVVEAFLELVELV